MHYEFIQRAMVEVVLMGLTCGIIGTYVVLRGMAFIGDALSHAIFPGVVIALPVENLLLYWCSSLGV